MEGSKKNTITKAHPFSVEMFPPRTSEGMLKLDSVVKILQKFRLEYFSVTYGAGGATKQGTRDLVRRFLKRDINAVPHLSFGGTTEEEMRTILEEYRKLGVRRLVVLRGDLPSGVGMSTQQPHASDLVQFIRAETGDFFHIDVACYPETHPESDSVITDIEYFKKKVRAGANSAITQYFYNVDAYFEFTSQCQKEGIDLPIVPGIMPITNHANLIKFSSACGAEIPRWLRKRLEALESNNDDLCKYGVEVVSKMCEKLFEGGAPGLHFYSMNRSGPIIEIIKNLGISAASPQQNLKNS
ncbi:methylenetetrahydrofolate reductase [NAD(P)H] [Gammaproteobacteria bacterium]|nr:methylenetetrahydrofolate reductase [NAD(P)H] [Gammaproteobacteria bacterium]